MTTNSLPARSNEYSDQRSGVGDFVCGQRMRDFAKRGKSSTLKFFLVVILIHNSISNNFGWLLKHPCTMFCIYVKVQSAFLN